MRIVNKKIILVSILLVVVTTGVLICRLHSDKETQLDSVSLKEEVNNDMFAIMLEQDDGTYKESTDNVWPTSAYIYDVTKSGCIDANGNKIEDSLTYDLINNIATVETGNTSYCYLYFSKPINLYELCDGTNNMGDCLENREEQVYMVNNVTDEIIGGLYRYQGTHDKVQDNYICFGASTIEECIGSEYKEGIYDETKFSKYMYRIIGVNSVGNLKIIKKEALETTYSWNKDDASDIPWGESDLYKGLNGIEGGTYNNIFINNSDYEYMLETNEWYSKIESINWKYGDVTINNYPNAIYEVENNYENKTSLSKIGLMYLHDYFYSESWIHLNYNDNVENGILKPTISPPRDIEWTMSRYGLKNEVYRVWNIFSSEIATGGHSAANAFAVRPVFYLKDTIKIVSGDGTATNPYIIE